MAETRQDGGRRGPRTGIMSSLLLLLLFLILLLLARFFAQAPSLPTHSKLIKHLPPTHSKLMRYSPWFFAQAPSLPAKL